MRPGLGFAQSLAAFLLRVALLEAFWKGGVVKERRKGWLFFLRSGAFPLPECRALSTTFMPC